jgi:hypothetical protein
MPKRVQKRKMSKRGGGWFDNPGAEIVALPGNVAQGVAALPATVAALPATVAALPGNVVKAADVVVEETKKGVQGASQGASGFWVSLFGNGNQAAPAPATGAVVVVPPQEQPVVVGGSRRHRRHKKSKSMFSGLMKMVGFKTKRRGRKGGIGGPSNGYLHLVGANFPSAANAQGNNIYDLAPFDPSKPFTGGMKGVMKGGCMPNKLLPLTPAVYPSGVSDMFGGKTRHRRKRSGGKSKKHGW